MFVFDLLKFSKICFKISESFVPSSLFLNYYNSNSSLVDGKISFTRKSISDYYKLDPLYSYVCSND